MIINDKYQLTENPNDNTVRLFYKGPVDQRILSVTGDYINTVDEIEQKAGRKLFTTFLELAQNISYYSEDIIMLNDKKVGSGTIIIKETKKQFFLLTGNTVKNENIVAIIEKCEYINSLDRDSLREYKRKERSRKAGVKGNAHIGLIQVALTSANPLDVEVNPIDQHTVYFSIVIKIDKK